jgi:hypothetical protein
MPVPITIELGVMKRPIDPVEMRCGADIGAVGE